jgi:predicted metal-dependent hydrolase
MKEKAIKDLQDNLEIQKQMFKSETERLEREKREKENLIAEMKHENTQLRESMQLQLNQSQMSNQMELHRFEEMIRNLQYEN